MTSEPRVVGIFNTSEDMTTLLRMALEHAGFTAVTAFTNRLRDGRTDLESFMRQYRPRVIVYDVALPYDANWRLFQQIRQSPACADVTFVVTTTNCKRLQEVAGKDAEGVIEIVGKPYDLAQLLDLVGRGFGSPQPIGAA
jgi:DNA-binding response OmpR family regulator